MTLVVQHHEFDEYRMTYKSTNIMRLPPEIKTISPTRQFILENAGTRFFIMMDDDLRFSRKRQDDRTKLKDCTSEDIGEMVELLYAKLRRHANVGLSSREGNNRKPNSVYYNERIMRVLGYDRDRVPPDCRFDRIPLKQDFDMTLQLLRHGLKNCVIYEFANDQVTGSNARGGCSNFRTEEMSEKAAHALKKLHPEFVSLSTKKNSNWKGFGSETRTDVMVQWKKAFEAGAR